MRQNGDSNVETWRGRGKLRREYGKTRLVNSFSFATCIAVALVGGITLCDSPAGAQWLENGVRSGDRSGLATIRPPRPGARRFGRPDGRTAGQDTAWFWTRLTQDTPARGADSRWQAALALLRDRRGLGGGLYGADDLGRIAAAWRGPVEAEATRRGVSQSLVLAVIAVESAGRARARSPKGALGLMQLIPATAQRFGVRDAFDPAQNVAGGVEYLDYLLDRFGGDVILALAGYNAGEGAVDRYGGVPPFDETRAYVVRVLDALIAAESLCATPPAGPRAPCPLGLREG